MARSRSHTSAASGATPAVSLLAEAGVEHILHRYEHDPAAASYGLEAAEALGVPPGRVFKTLLATPGKGLVVGLVPVSAQLDLKALARAVGAKSLTMADAKAAERATGYVVGGISPLGQKTRSPMVVDDTAASFPTIFVSAGRRGLEAELSAADLVLLTGAQLAPIARTG